MNTRSASLAFSLSIGVIVLTIPAGAQEPAARGEPRSDGVAAPATPAAVETTSRAIEDLVASIEDPERRARLVDQLKALLAVRGQGLSQVTEDAAGGLVGGMVGFFGNLSAQVRDTAVQLVTQVLALPEKVSALWEKLVADPAARKSFLYGAAAAVGTVLAAIAAAVVAWVLVRRPRARLARSDAAAPVPFLGRAVRLVSLTVLELVPQVALIGVAMGAVAGLGPPRESAAVTLSLVWALAVKQVVDSVIDLVLAPRAGKLRLLPLGDERAAALSGSLGRIGGLGVYGYFALEALRSLGTQELLLSPLRSLYGLLLLAAGVVLVLRERGPVRRQLLSLASRPAAVNGDGAPPAGAGSWRAALASGLGLWWLAAIIYMVGLYMVWVSGVEGVFVFVLGASVKSFLAVALAALFTSLARRLHLRLRAWSTVIAGRVPEVEPHIHKYLRGLYAVTLAVIVVAAVCLGLEAWGISVLRTLGSQAAQSVVSALMGILIIVLLSAATIDAATVFTQRHLEARERSGKATGKIRTLLPLTQKAIRAVVTAVAIIMILSQAGVNVGPILAGVGVLGLAIGFGAQTLVKDIITGIFILLEDTVTVGDTVQLNQVTGAVESINLRTLRLRDGTGFVHTIPFSSVEVVTNMSRDFGRCIVEVGVGYEEDVDGIADLLRQIDANLRQDPAFTADILEPLEVQGLERFDDSAVVVRGTLKTTPSGRMRVTREFNRRMKKLFDERGVNIPFPCRTIYVAGSKDLAANLTAAAGAGGS